MRDAVATKDFVNAKFDNYNERTRRIEDDLKEWTAISTAEHVRLDKDSKARHAKTESDLSALEERIENKIREAKTESQAKFDKQEERNFQIEQAQKNNRSNRVVQIALAALALIGTVVSPVVVYIIVNGSLAR